MRDDTGTPSETRVLRSNLQGVTRESKFNKAYKEDMDMENESSGIK